MSFYILKIKPIFSLIFFTIVCIFLIQKLTFKPNLKKKKQVKISRWGICMIDMEEWEQ